MSVDTFTDLYRHKGHKIVVAEYLGQDGKPVNIALECENCYEVLMDYEREGDNEYKPNKP
jgi:hypothetical protein